MTWVQTITGVAFDLKAPRAEDVRAVDIAHALAYSCRFGGHTRAHYSVAQHSILVAALVWHRTNDPAARLLALLHDAHEAFTGDLIQPMKQMIVAYVGGALRAIEGAVDSAIWRWANVTVNGALVAEVKRADAAILLWERDRFLGRPPQPWVLDGKVDELVDADFGVAPGSALLEAWRPEIAERAFNVAIRWCAPEVNESDVMVPAWLLHELRAGLVLSRARDVAGAGKEVHGG